MKTIRTLTGIDDVDRQLMNLLIEDGRMGNRELAAKVGLTDVTVATRLRTLIENRIFKVGAQIDWHAAGFSFGTTIFVNVSPLHRVSVSKELSAIPSLYFVGEVFGSVDFVLAGLVTDFDDVERLTDAITSIDGVTNVTVDINYEVLKYLHRYGRLNQQPIEVILPNPRVDVDELDRRIASSLIVDGRTSNRALARRFDCSEGTIRTRIRRMESDGLLKIRAQVDPFLSGELIALAYVGLCVGGDLGSTLIDQLVAMPAVYSLWRTSGRYQLVASVGAGNRGELVRAIKDDIQSLEGVRSLSTWEIARFVKMSSYLARLSLVDANTNENLT